MGRKALEVADQSSRGGGCLAGVGRARAQQSFHPQAASFCFTFRFPLPQHPGGEVWSQAGEGGQGGVVEETGSRTVTSAELGPDLTLGVGSRLPATPWLLAACAVVTFARGQLPPLFPLNVLLEHLKHAHRQTHMQNPVFPPSLSSSEPRTRPTLSKPSTQLVTFF